MSTGGGPSARRGVAAGLAAALAMLGAMALDLRLTGERTNELRLLAGMVPGGRRHWAVVGTLMHLANGAALGALYTRVAPRLPGPGWLRGIIFAEVENAALWPALLLLERVHPGFRSGEIASYNRPRAALLEVTRHLAYGATLGALLGRPRAAR